MRDSAEETRTSELSDVVYTEFDDYEPEEDDDRDIVETTQTTQKKKTSDKNKLTFDTCVDIGFNVFRQFDDPYYAGFAASVAYFFFMASIPTLVVLSQVLGLFDLSLDIIRDWLSIHISENMSGFVIGLFSASSSKTTNLIFILVAIWAASSLEFSLSRLASYVMTEGTYKFNFFSERLNIIPSAILSITTIAFSLIVFLYGENILNRVVQRVEFLRVLVPLKFPIAFGLFFAMILVNYYILPRIRVPFKAIIPGAVVASVGIMIITVIYGLYIGFIADYDILYGAFANVVMLMLWFYLLSWVLCIGMMVNKAWDQILEKNLLTKEKMVEYLSKQVSKNTDVESLFIHDDDKYYPHTESLAVKMSRKYVKGYSEKLEQEKRDLEEKRKMEMLAQDLYEEYISD